MKKTELLVIGGGAWGTALANVLAEKNDVHLLAIEQERCQEINQLHTNSTFFSAKLNKRLVAISSMPDLMDYKMIVLAVPTSATISVAKNIIKQSHRPGVIITNAAKGFDPTTNKIMSIALKEVFATANVKVASIMGPGFAAEVVGKQLTAVNAIADSMDDAKVVQEYFANDYFRVYTSTDLIGAEICSAIKNVVAIAAGIVEGLGYQNNTKAALITRGLKDIVTYGLKYNCQTQTFLGLCGIGDLTLTCSTKDSRNYKLGYEIGRHNSATLLDNYPYTVEGVNTTKVIYNNKGQLELPIIEAVYQVLFARANPKEVVASLMRRELKPEF